MVTAGKPVRNLAADAEMALTAGLGERRDDNRKDISVMIEALFFYLFAGVMLASSFAGRGIAQPGLFRCGWIAGGLVAGLFLVGGAGISGNAAGGGVCRRGCSAVPFRGDDA